MIQNTRSANYSTYDSPSWSYIILAVFVYRVYAVTLGTKLSGLLHKNKRMLKKADSRKSRLNGAVREVVLFLTAGLLATNFSIGVAQKNVCGGNSTPVVRDISNTTEIVESTSTVNGTSMEWIFEADNFITVSFSEFDLLGPDCGRDVPSYSKVLVNTQLDGDEAPRYVFCKGRRPPYDPMSSKDRLHVAYCNRYAGGKIKFEVSSNCTAQLLVQQRKKTVIIQNRQTAKDCWIGLTSLRGFIIANFSAVRTKQNKRDKCQRAYISVISIDQSTYGDSLLPYGSEKLCNTKTGITVKPFVVTTKSRHVKVAYKSADFTLTFWETTEALETTARTDASTGDDDFGGRPTINGSEVEGYRGNDEPGSDGTSTGHIVAIGCGGLFVLLVIIGTLIFVKKRSTKTSSSRSSKKRSSTTRSGDGVVRNPSIGSIDNAMYGQFVNGSNGTEHNTREERGSDARRQRLVELEEKYGPFPETSTSFQQSQRLFRKDTRPQLPPPTKTLPCVSNNPQHISSAAGNTYETIDDIQAQRKLLTTANEKRRASYLTVTSDEFSEDDEPIPDPMTYEQGENYATILDGPTVSYDPVDEGRQSTTPAVEYFDNSAHAINIPENHRSTPRIHSGSSSFGVPPPQVSANAHLLSHPEPSYQTPNKSARRLKPSLFQAKSHGSLAPRRLEDYLAPRPSLPNVNPGTRNASLASSLLEDDENYLRPRPSCPDAMVACAYSSTEDVSELRRRLLAAAHPSLLQDVQDSPSVTQRSTSQTAPKYDSPRPSRTDNNLHIPPSVQYASPRRKNQA